jgi:hypothetical protein
MGTSCCNRVSPQTACFRMHRHPDTIASITRC